MENVKEGELLVFKFENWRKLLNFTGFSAGKDEFVKENITNIKNLNLPYDFKSIMHYQRGEFSKNGEDTLVALNQFIDMNKMGKYEKLSKGNIREILQLYKCTCEYLIKSSIAQRVVQILNGNRN